MDRMVRVVEEARVAEHHWEARTSLCRSACVLLLAGGAWWLGYCPGYALFVIVLVTSIYFIGPDVSDPVGWRELDAMQTEVEVDGVTVAVPMGGGPPTPMQVRAARWRNFERMCLVLLMSYGSWYSYWPDFVPYGMCAAVLPTVYADWTDPGFHDRYKLENKQREARARRQA